MRRVFLVLVFLECSILSTFAGGDYGRVGSEFYRAVGEFCTDSITADNLTGLDIDFSTSPQWTDDLEQDLGQPIILGTPSAYRGVLEQAQGFGFSFLRYRARGYDYRVTRERITFNDIELDDQFSGAPLWWAISGVDRLSGAGYGGRSSSAFPARQLTVHPQDLRGGAKVAYSFSNRTFTNRLSAQWVGHFTGRWSVVVSASAAGGRSLSVDGVHAADLSFFASASKRYGADGRHVSQFSIIYSPSERALQGASTSEAFQLTSNNLYNPYWGYFDGRVRNTRVRRSSMPVLVAEHVWRIDDRTTFRARASLGIGSQSNTALNWQNAPNPNPDYYRNMPSFESSEQGADQIADLWRADPSVSGVNYQFLYDFNDYNGPRGSYIMERKVRRLIIAGLGVSVERVSKDGNRFLQVDLSYRTQNEHNYKVVDDLFGSDYWLDIDSFVEEQGDVKPLSQSDARNPNRTVRLGDIFGYNYALNINRYAAHASLRQLLGDFTVGANLGFQQSTSRRTGYYHKGNFASENSYGRSDLLLTADYRAELWAAYSLGNRVHLRFDVSYLNASPRLQDIYLSPRYHSALISDPKSQQNLGLQFQAIYRRANFNLTASIYYTLISSGSELRSFYDDFNHSYSHYSLQDISRSYLGFELGVQFNMGANLWLSGMLAISDNRYTNDPVATQYLESTGERVLQESVMYHGLHCGSSPEDVARIELSYRPWPWVVSMSCNYFSGNFVSLSPLRYTVRAIAALQQQEPLRQEKLAYGATLDLFAGRSFTLRSKRLGIYLGINNILNRKNITTSAYQSPRPAHATRYYHALGINGFINVSLTF